MIKATLNTLLTHLRKKHPQASIQEETGQIVLHLSIEGVDFPLFFRAIEGSPTLQLMTFLPFSLKYADKGEVARLLHILNKEVDLPGFGMDEMNELVFFRLLVPLFEGRVSPAMLDAHVEASERTIQLFLKGIGAVIAGEVSIDAVLQKAMQHPAPVG